MVRVFSLFIKLNYANHEYVWGPNVSDSPDAFASQMPQQGPGKSVFLELEAVVLKLYCASLGYLTFKYHLGS